jgi:hypothetical protein
MYKKNFFINIQKGDYVFDFGNKGPRMKCICSPKGGGEFDTAKENNLSLCFLIEYGNFRYYTGGDTDGDNELSVAKSIKNECANKTLFYKVGHHGSKVSSTPDFLNCLNPQVAFISCGNDDMTERHGHPTVKCLENLKNKNSIKNMFLTSCLPGKNGIIEDNYDIRQTGKAIVSGLEGYYEYIAKGGETKYDDDGDIIEEKAKPGEKIINHVFRQGDILLEVCPVFGELSSYVSYWEMYKGINDLNNFRYTTKYYPINKI